MQLVPFVGNEENLFPTLNMVTTKGWQCYQALKGFAEGLSLIKHATWNQSSGLPISRTASQSYRGYNEDRSSNSSLQHGNIGFLQCKMHCTAWVICPPSWKPAPSCWQPTQTWQQLERNNPTKTSSNPVIHSWHHWCAISQLSEHTGVIPQILLLCLTNPSQKPFVINTTIIWTLMTAPLICKSTWMPSLQLCYS